MFGASLGLSTPFSAGVRPTQSSTVLRSGSHIHDQNYCFTRFFHFKLIMFCQQNLKLLHCNALIIGLISTPLSPTLRGRGITIRTGIKDYGNYDTLIELIEQGAENKTKKNTLNIYINYK